MGRMRTGVVTAALLGLALLSAAAASTGQASATSPMHVAVTQPLAPIGAQKALGRLMLVGDGQLPEPGLLVLVGTSLLGLASIVRRSTRV